MITTATYHHHGITITTCVSHSLYAVGLERWRDEFKVHDLQQERVRVPPTPLTVYVCDVNSSDGLREGTVLL